MIFEGRPIDEITDEEIDRLITEHVAERQHLEFKVTVNHRNDSEKLELLRDIASLANGGGGYLIVGIRDDGKGCALEYEPALIGDTVQIKKAVASLCHDHIRERIDGLEIKERNVKGNQLVLVRVPASSRIPHMVTFQNRTDFYCRYEDGKREMTLGEIRDLFKKDSLSLSLSKIEARLSELATRAIEEQTNSGLDLVAIQDGNTLSIETLKRFSADIRRQPFFRIAATPESPKENLVDVNSPDIRNLIANPAGSRYSGWNMRPEGQPIEIFSAGIYWGSKEFEHLELFNNGHMEFSTPLGEHFCWRQSEEEFRTNPTLYSYPVVEYPVTFLRLYRELVKLVGINCEILVDMSYANVRGYALLPHKPNTWGFITGDASKKQKDESIDILRRHYPADFDPDTVAYELIEKVFASFGLEKNKIPFRTSTGSFDFG
jgi:hypothetical protein